MKKITILSSLLALATVGGVYATWTYAGTNDIVDAFTEAKVTLEGATLNGSNGLYTVTTNLVMTIDQKSENDHTAVLNYASNNGDPMHITIRFTPAAFAPEEIKKAGVPTEYYFGTTVDMKYKIDAQGNLASYKPFTTPKKVEFSLINPKDTVFDFKTKKQVPIKNGKGVSVVVPISSVMGLSLYQFMINNKKNRGE